MCTSSVLRLEIPSRFEDLDLVDSLLEALLEHAGLEEADRSNLVLAVREAAANAIQHGNQLDPSKRTTIEAAIGRDELEIMVQDQGAGFDLDALPDPLAPENLLKPSGRGILLMRNFMDQVSFEFPEGGGTLVSMRKSVSSVDQNS